MELQNLSLEELEEIRRGLLVKRSREYSIEGCKAFYERRNGNKIPQYQVDEWLVPIFGMDTHDLGVMVEAFRGSWKTTTVSITWGEFNIIDAVCLSASFIINKF